MDNYNKPSIKDPEYLQKIDFNSVRHSYATNMPPGDRENISMYSAQPYSQTQKYSPQAHYDGGFINLATKETSKFIDPADAEISKIRMLDSRMTEDELDINMPSDRSNRNIRKNHKIVTNALLNNSYDDIKSNKKKKITTTHRKDGNKANSTLRGNRSHRKQRSISTRSNRNHGQILRASRISDSQSERSFSSRKDRSLSMSLRNEKNELKDTLKKVRKEEQYQDALTKIDELKAKLAKERKKNHDLERANETMMKKVEKYDKLRQQKKEITKEYNALLEAFEKSEQLREAQKQTIAALRVSSNNFMF